MPGGTAAAVLFSVVPAELNSAPAQKLRSRPDFRPVRLLKELPAISEVPIIAGGHAEEGR